MTMVRRPIDEAKIEERREDRNGHDRQANDSTDQTFEALDRMQGDVQTQTLIRCKHSLEQVESFVAQLLLVETPKEMTLETHWMNAFGLSEKIFFCSIADKHLVLRHVTLRRRKNIRSTSQ